MIKKITPVLIMFAFVFCSTVPLFASGAAEGPDGNKRKGKYTYRKVCKSCAEAGEIESATPVVSPSDKKMGEWKSIFESKDFQTFGCLDHWAKLSESDILDIYSYFYHHAADSPTPATCK